VFEGHTQRERSFARAFGKLGQKVAAKIDFLDFSFIVLISVDAHLNISTIRNYRHQFDTNTMYESKIQIIICATSFTLAQWPTANSSWIALAVALACNQAPTVE